MQYNENITEALAVLGFLAPASQSAAAHTIGPFNTKLMRRVVFVVELGALGSSATVDFKLQASATQSGTYADVTGTAITEISSGATNLVLVEIKAETLGSLGVGPWIQGVLTVGTAASQASVLALGTAGYYPSSDYSAVTPTQVLVA